MSENKNDEILDIIKESQRGGKPIIEIDESDNVHEVPIPSEINPTFEADESVMDDQGDQVKEEVCASYKYDLLRTEIIMLMQAVAKGDKHISLDSNYATVYKRRQYVDRNQNIARNLLRDLKIQW